MINRGMPLGQAAKAGAQFTSRAKKSRQAIIRRRPWEHNSCGARFLPSSGRDPEHHLHMRALTLAQPAEAVAYAWMACLTCDLRGAVQVVSAPSLIIAGRSD